jgi:hypothetical protein
VKRSSRAVALGALALVLAFSAQPIFAAPARPSGANDVSKAAAPKTPASELRVALGRLLAEHAFLTMELMRAVRTNGPDRDALSATVERNSSELQAAITSLYGAAGGRAFGQLWRSHIAHLVEYARADAAGDQAGRTRALQQLAAYSRNFANFLATANPQLTAAGEAEQLQLHVRQLTAFASNDYRRAYAAQRQAYSHMFRYADHLALGIINQFPGKLPGDEVAFSPAISLRLTLSRLLGEHAILAGEAMRAGLTNAPDLQALLGALEGNNADLEAAVGQVYGAPAGRAFGQLWRAHIGYYVAYIQAAGANDAAKQQQAQDQLAGYAGTFGNFMARANPHLTATAVAGLVRDHARTLMEQVDAYDAGDYQRAYGNVRHAYAHTFTIGDALAGAILTQFPDRFPATPPATDTARDGGTELPSRQSQPAALTVAVLALAFVLGLRLAPSLRRR